MFPSRRIIVLITCLTIPLVFLTSCREDDTSADYPSRPIKLIVPFSAGGGTDTFARIIKKAIDDNDLLPQPLVIINQGGAGATIGSRRVKDAEPDGYTMLVLHEAILTARYSGVVDYGPEAFEPIAGTGEVGMVIAVSEDSQFTSLDELMQTVTEQPAQVSFAANVGAMTHFAALQLEKAHAAKRGSEQDEESAQPRFRIAQSGGGADRYADLLGGHVDVTGFSIEEFVRFRSEGIRGLAFLGEQRHPAAPDLPTADELGLDVAMSNIFYWWFPRGTPPGRVAAMSKVLQAAMATEYVQRKMAEIQCEPLVLIGPDLHERLAERARKMASVAPREVIQPPDLVLLVGIAIGVLVLVVVVQELRWWKNRSVHLAEDNTMLRYGFRSPGEPPPHLLLALSSVAFTVLYVSLMGSGLLGYRIATAGYVFTLGLALGRPHWKTAVGTAGLALVLSVGVHSLLTEVLTVDLP